MTHGEALRWAIDRLKAGSEWPRADAYRLLEHVVGCSSAWLIAHDTERMSQAACRELGDAVERRRRGAPIAYIVGRAGFFGDAYDVNPAVLVPRPETEHLVEAAIDFLRRRLSAGEAANVLDIGTGSGAIACAIARALPQVSVDATDISAVAIGVARENAARLRVEQRCRFFVGDLATPVQGEQYSCIVANLPYIPSAELKGRRGSVEHEPRRALDGGLDGLDAYRRLLPQLRPLLAHAAAVLLEGAPSTIDGLGVLAREHFPEAHVSVHRDYANIDRFIVLSLSLH